MGTKRQSSVESNEFLKVNIDLPSLQMNIKSARPLEALRELRKVLELLHLDDEIVYEEFVTEEIKTVFSDTFARNRRVMDVVKKLLKQEDDYRLASVELGTNATLDLRDGSKSVKVDRKDVKRAVSRITRNIDIKCVKHGIIHINGDVDDESKLVIADHVHKYMPTAQLRAFHSDGMTGKVVVECIFFGDFPEV